MDFKGTLGALWAVVIAVALGAVIYGIRSEFDAISKIMVAVIGATAVLLGAILTHVLAVDREQQQTLQRRKQENYAALVAKLTPFVRDPGRQLDDLTNVYLDSWVVGSPEVIERTASFMSKRTPSNLVALLGAMRRDIGLPEIDVELGPVLRVPERLVHGLEPDEDSD